VNREALVAKLGMLEDALPGVKMLVPAFAHVWLQDVQITAFSDFVAVQLPLKSGIHGGVPGRMLRSLLAHSSSPEVKMTPDANGQQTTTLRIETQGSRLKMPLMPREVFENLFDMPKPNPKLVLPVDFASFMPAIKGCLRSVRTGFDRPTAPTRVA